MTEANSSRRTVIKGAAWAAPVVVVATATPAMAASGAALLGVVVNAASGIDNALGDSVAISSLVSNTRPLASTALTVTLTVTMVDANRWGVATASATGYSNNLPVIGQGTGVTRTFDFTAQAQIAGNGVKAFNPTVTTGSTQNPSGDVTVLATPGGAGTAGSGARAIA